MIHARKSIVHIILMVYVAIIIVPFIFVILSSMKTDNQAIAANPWGLPSVITFDNYIKAWINANINVYFFNSAYISVAASTAAIIIAAATAYAITRMKFSKVNVIVFSFISLGLFIPGNALLIPIYSMLRWFGIYNTPFALILPYIAFALPLTVLVLSAFMRSIPNEIEEASIVDGLSAVGVFFKIILPISTPALVTVFIINFLGNWNEFLLANFYISSDHLKTLPVGMVGFRDKYNTNYAQLSAGIGYSVLPVLVMYSILQEKIIEGVTAGSVKG
jgi:raffinose/stachyose/melibiose transport system permease protein